MKPIRLGRDQLDVFHRLFEVAANGIGAVVTERTRMDFVCDCLAVEQIRFSSWTRELEGASAIWLVRLEPFVQPALFVVSAPFLTGAIDRLLGGTGHDPEPCTEFTPTEYTVADTLVGPMLQRICDGLSELGALSWTIESRFSNPTFARVIRPNDVVLSVQLRLQSEALTGEVGLALPFSQLEPHLGEIERARSPASTIAPGAMRGRVERAMREVPVELRVELGQRGLSVGRLLELREGDVIRLPRSVGDPLQVSVEGRPKFLGQIGRQGSQLALRVTEVVGDE